MKEVPFHAAYIVFSLIAVWAMWSLARRFSPRPLWATLLFIAVPAFVVNGNSLETDLPFLAFWMAAIALFLSGRLAACRARDGGGRDDGVPGGVSDSDFVLWDAGSAVRCSRGRDRPEAYRTCSPRSLVFVAWQVFTRLTTGTMPAGKLAEYFSTYALQAIQHKLAERADALHP